MKDGYKQMLRDRMPKTLDLALRWCKAKNRWIDYVYSNTIKKEAKERRSNAVKILLGIKQQYKRQQIHDEIKYCELKNITMTQVNNIPKSELYMKFSESIDWNKLLCNDRGMYEYWKIVAEWVDWFSKTYVKIEDTYTHSLSWGITDNEIAPIIMSKYGIDRKLTDYLIKSFK